MLKCYLPAAGYSPARAFVWFSLEFLLGCLMAALGVDLAVALLAFFMTLGLGLFLLWPRKSVLLIALALLISFGWGLWRKAEQEPQSDDLSYVHSAQVTVRGRVEEVRERCGAGKHSLNLVLAVRSLQWPYQAPLSGRVLVQLLISSQEVGQEAGQEAGQMAIRPLPGQELELTGALECPSPRHFSFEFDEATWLARQGIYCRLQCSADPAHCRVLLVESRLSASRVDKLFVFLYQWLGAEAEKLRRIIVGRHNDHLGPLLGPLLSSIVMGDRVVAVDAGIKNEFSRIGLSHLLAASGLNLTIIVAFALALCRRRQAGGGWLEAWMSLLCVLSFVTLAGSGPSVNRAAVMCLVALWARLTFLKTQAGVTLALALLLALALEPASVLDIGLQFSYAATFGIIYIFPLLEAGFLRHISMPLLKGAAGLTAVVISAQLAVLPVQLVHFQQLSLLVLPANLLAEPVVVPLTILGFISSILAAFGQPQLLHTVSVWSTGLLDGLASYPLQWLVLLAHNLALCPLASVCLPGPGAVHLLLYYCFLFYCLLGLKLRPALSAVFLCLSCLLLIFLSYMQSPLLEIFLTGKQLVVNQGNRRFFVCELVKQRTIAKSADCRYAAHLKHIGLPQVAAPPLVAGGMEPGEELTLADEGLKIVVRQWQGRVSELSVQSLTAGSCISLYYPCSRSCSRSCRVLTACWGGWLLALILNDHIACAWTFILILLLLKATLRLLATAQAGQGQAVARDSNANANAATIFGSSKGPELELGELIEWAVIIFSTVCLLTSNVLKIDLTRRPIKRQAIEITLLSPADAIDRGELLPANTIAQDSRKHHGHLIDQIGTAEKNGAAAPLSLPRQLPTSKPQPQKPSQAKPAPMVHTTDDGKDSQIITPPEKPSNQPSPTDRAFQFNAPSGWKTIVVAPAAGAKAPEQTKAAVTANKDRLVKHWGEMLSEVPASSLIESVDNDGEANILAQTGGHSANGNGSASSLHQYLKEVNRRIKRNWLPKGQQDVAVIQFRIGKNGKLLETSSFSGDGPAEATAIAAIKKAFPFRPLPESVKAPYLDVRYTFNYRVNDMSEIPLQPTQD